MEELKAGGVEALARQTRHGFFGPVHRVPQDGVADIGQVYADLVGAACFQPAAQVGDALIAGDDLPVGHGPASVRHHGHFFPVCAVAADGGIHGAAVLLEIAYGQTLVGPGQGMVGQLGGQTGVGGIVFSGDDEAAGVPVDAVDDAGAQLAADARKAPGAVVQQGIDQGAVRVPRGRVDHHAHGLIHHDHIRVLVDHLQGNVLGPGLRLLRLGKGHGDRFTAGEARTFPGGLTVYGDKAALNEPGRCRTGQVREPGGQEGVQPGPGGFSCGRQGPCVHGCAPSCHIYRRTTGSTPRPARRPPPRSNPPG